MLTFLTVTTLALIRKTRVSHITLLLGNGIRDICSFLRMNFDVQISLIKLLLTSLFSMAKLYSFLGSIQQGPLNHTTKRWRRQKRQKKHGLEKY